MRPPIQGVTHSCTLPSDRTGYHVVMAVWNIGDTQGAFYNMIDLELGTATPTAPAPSPVAPAPSPTVAYCSWTGSCGGGDPAATYCNASQQRCIGECGGSVYCSGSGSSTTTTTTTAPSCGGGNVGNGRCSGGLCCSQWGWCGCTSSHCTNGQVCARRGLRGIFDDEEEENEDGYFEEESAHGRVVVASGGDEVGSEYSADVGGTSGVDAIVLN